MFTLKPFECSGFGITVVPINDGTKTQYRFEGSDRVVDEIPESIELLGAEYTLESKTTCESGNFIFLKYI